MVQRQPCWRLDVVGDSGKRADLTEVSFPFREHRSTSAKIFANSPDGRPPAAQLPRNQPRASRKNANHRFVTAIGFQKVSQFLPVRFVEVSLTLVRRLELQQNTDQIAELLIV